MHSIGSFITARRKMLRISQKDLASLAGVGINTLVKIERGEGNPTISVLQKVMDVLGLELTCNVKTLNDETSGGLQ